MTIYHDIDHHGYGIVRGGIPPELVATLRAQHSRCTEVARGLFGPTAHRLQSLPEHGVPVALLTQLIELPAMRNVYADLGDDRFFGPYLDDPFKEISFVMSPESHPRCTYWHRDWRDRILNGRPLSDDQWANAMRNFRHFIGITFALDDDDSFWYVPGSQRRPDTAAESAMRRHANLRWSEWDDVLSQRYPGSVEDEMFEFIVRDYVEEMPNCTNVKLRAGDILMFSTIGWHLGTYLPTRPRRIVQGVLGTSTFSKWCDDHARFNIEYDRYAIAHADAVPV